ncbi:ABC transporter ATP-binding protein [Labedella endophytica]|uniref:ABC transporter ATP-binding protein n=1 Tax=Labedella endophytica TaxID=1523160 RepID=A0A433JN54_9MICO|nr:ABC transporter ATP-binding protein [Labedella endophytica]RUQ97546.1 ABC transporter ATP-binding protein [Labedella endophytica]
MTGGARITATGWGWRHAGRKRSAVADITLDVEAGERILLLGASGSGKSTLLAGLAGLLGGEEDGEQTGALAIDGLDARAARGRVGLVLQDPDAAPVFSRVGDDVAFGCENLEVPREEIWRRVRRSLDAVGLAVPLDRSTSELSGGEKQRLALAGVLAMEPDVVLLDEPTANLDPAGVADVRRAIEDAVVPTGATLVVVEHRTEVWLDLITRVIVLDAGGGLLADGSPEHVFAIAGDALAAAGVWVPGVPMALPLAGPPRVGAPTTALAAIDLSIGRPGAGVIRRGVDLRVPEATSTVVVGPNGAGKSTLALTLAGLLPERSGLVTVSEQLRARRGRRPSQWSSRELLTRIGTVFQDPEHQFLASTVRDELAIGPRALKLGESEATARVDELLDILGLTDLARANPFTLSGGQKRRLSVGTVLASRPAVIILDEPTFGQDRVSWTRLVGLLQDLVGEGSTVVSVTHDAGVVLHLGQQVVTVDAPVVPDGDRVAA